MAYKGGATSRRGADLETYLSVKAYGAVGNGSNDDTSAIQAALDAADSAGGGVVFFPAGTYKVTDTLTYAEEVCFQGEGPDASRLDWPSSVGAGVWGIEPSYSFGTYGRLTIEKLGFFGPSTGASLTPGTANTNMHGVKIGRRTVLRDCQVRGFNYGVGIQNDHAWLENVEASANHANVVWLDTGGVSQYGDHTILNCTLDGATLASIYVEDGSLIDGSTFISTHLGLAPYGITCASGRSETRFVTNSVFIDVACEQFGNAVIYDPNTAGLFNDNRWFGGSQFIQDSTFKISATTYDFMFELGSVNRFNFDFKGYPSQVPASAWIKANDLNSIQLNGLTSDVLGAGKPILWGGSGGTGTAAVCSSRNDSGQGIFSRAQEGISVNQLVDANDESNCGLWTNASNPPIGVARQTVTSNQILAIQSRGRCTAIGDGVITLARPIKPSTTSNGKFTQASDNIDSSRCGWAGTGASGDNATFTAVINFAGWGS